MTIHREGYSTIILVLIVCLVISGALFFLSVPTIVTWPASAFLLAFWLFIVSFFRLPSRAVELNENNIIAPADGKIVVIEETEEKEYFKDKRLMVSIFMSPLNVHVNLYPISGSIPYAKYHKGKYLVASLPKAAEENERTTTVIKTADGKELLVRQVAGAVARRIVHYAEKGKEVKQCNELGFIKFGSRVDIYLPVGTKVNVEMNQKVHGKQTVIATW